MFLIAAAAIASTAHAPPPPRAPAKVELQATATVRIVSGVEVHFGRGPQGDAPPARDAVIRTDGHAQSAKLIEFE